MEHGPNSEPIRDNNYLAHMGKLLATYGEYFE